MDIIIPTYGRSNPVQQTTLFHLLEEEIIPTLVVQQREERLYEWFHEEHGTPIVVLPDSIRTISATRDFIIHDTSFVDKKVVMLDDDLDFAVRRVDDPTKFRSMSPDMGMMKDMLEDIEDALHSYNHVGIGAREGGNRVTELLIENTRIMRVLAYDRHYLRRAGIFFRPMEVMEDFHVSLQILRRGMPTAVLNGWVSNQAGGSGATGGCSSYRTEAIQTAAAHRLAALHPGFVKVVQKATKGAWGGGTRTDVRIQWKKAYESAHND